MIVYFSSWRQHSMKYFPKWISTEWEISSYSSSERYIGSLYYCDVITKVLSGNKWCWPCMMGHNQEEYLNNNSPFAITVTLACPIFCPSSDTIQVYTTLVNFASTLIVCPFSDWLDQCHVMFASDWSVWHVRVTLSSWHRVLSLGDDVIVTFVELAVTKLAAVYYIYSVNHSPKWI